MKITVSPLENAARIAERTERLAEGTMSTLVKQGDQIHRIERKVEDVNQQLGAVDQQIATLEGSWWQRCFGRWAKTVPKAPPHPKPRTQATASDDALDRIDASVKNLKAIATAMGRELDDHNQTLDRVIDGVDEANDRTSNGIRRVDMVRAGL